MILQAEAAMRPQTSGGLLMRRHCPVTKLMDTQDYRPPPVTLNEPPCAALPQ